MTRDWKPGDVAMVRTRTLAGIPNAERAMFRVDAGIPLGARTEDGDVWMLHHGGHCVDENAESVRPLVVIDPESSEQVDQLTKAVVEACYRDGNLTVSDNGIHSDTMQAALREFANPTPPKPEEPQGLGAVVEDANGVPWVRCENAELEPHWYARNKMKKFADVAAVRVLSEGWTA